ncbi:MAG: hypothetical protein IJX74_06775 [Clostridia bacterium]|nr:hypothetical protein [Clostridia bacterium]
MSKSLKTVQVFFKIAEIVCLVLFIFSIIGAVGGLVGASLLFTLGNMELPGIGDSISGMIMSESGLSYWDTCYSCVAAVIGCVGMGIVYKFAHVYFKNENAVGTPFTYEGSKELLRLGILAMAIPMAVYMLTDLVWGICFLLAPYEFTLVNEFSADITGGLMLLIASFVFKYGAELNEAKEKAEAEATAAQARLAAVPEEIPTAPAEADVEITVEAEVKTEADANV